ncbi:PREDICTED: endothelial lipase-like [Wasmannia auropunctata]|uniref:endothelial lipase-like n=1 Tax=Wasmannia auropunctata TaxID=64793 RepID=UPI0005EDA680|nr:PREDICTED: endothelial lipase-like [Wasmannia auropunctata]
MTIKMLPSIVYSYILLCFMTWIKPGQPFFFCSCNGNIDSKFANGINLVHYKCDGTNTSYPITAPQDLLTVLDTKRTIFYIFGYLQYPTHPNVQLMIKTLCKGGKDNVVLVDWSKYSNDTFYPLVFYNAQKVGKLFARSLEILVAAGLDSFKIYIIGFSVGAHVGGFAGKCNNFTIPRITGLDPANPFLSLCLGCYLSSDDAEFVDSMTSGMPVFGSFPFPRMATAHFLLNGGYSQPNCSLISLLTDPTNLLPTVFCSHRRAVEVYAYSALNPSKYNATLCSIPQLLNSCINKKDKCTGKQYLVGYNASNVPGYFYVDTKGQ